MPNQRSDRFSQRLCRGSRRLVVMGLLIWLAPLLVGCMEALRTGPEDAPPVLRSPTALTPSFAPSASAEAVLLTPPSSPTVATVPVTPSVAPTLSLSPSVPNTTATASAVPLPTLALATPLPLNNEQRWRTQQTDRRPFAALRSYFTSGSELLWYDPLNQQSVVLGQITGAFSAQAEFVLRGQGLPALEVPYQVNRSYGLTALSPALVERIAAAGKSEWIETYVVVTPNISPR